VVVVVWVVVVVVVVCVPVVVVCAPPALPPVLAPPVAPPVLAGAALGAGALFAGAEGFVVAALARVAAPSSPARIKAAEPHPAAL
jgi:hypothetical protein